MRHARGVHSVVVDHAFTTRSEGSDDDSVLGETGPATDDMPADATTLREVRTAIGADALDSGGDVDVALIDSGITPVDGLDAPGKIVNGPDFSFDRRNPDLRNLDAFGHGTHLAGIIAGVAPQARLVNLKAANAEGVTSLTQLLMAIDYAVRYRHANGLDIRVITLAVGADNDSGYERAPLAFAVERAWNAGIVVVAAPATTATPARASSSRPPTRSCSPSAARTPGHGRSERRRGRRLVEPRRRHAQPRRHRTRLLDRLLRVPGSYIDQSSEGRVGDALQRGSGTSQAAAVTAGAVALLLERHRYWNPNQLKAALRETARPMAGDPRATGEGALDLAAADAARPSGQPQGFRPRALFDGYRAGRRYSVGVRRLRDFLGRRWTGRRWTGVKWNGVKWNGVKW